MRKHKRTRFTTLSFQHDYPSGEPAKVLKPGRYRIHEVSDAGGYVGTFVVRSDHTVDFYGRNLIIKND